MRGVPVHLNVPSLALVEQVAVRTGIRLDPGGSAVGGFVDASLARPQIERRGVLRIDAEAAGGSRRKGRRRDVFPRAGCVRGACGHLDVRASCVGQHGNGSAHAGRAAGAGRPARTLAAALAGGAAGAGAGSRAAGAAFGGRSPGATRARGISRAAVPAGSSGVVVVPPASIFVASVPSSTLTPSSALLHAGTHATMRRILSTVLRSVHPRISLMGPRPRRLRLYAEGAAPIIDPEQNYR